MAPIKAAALVASPNPPSLGQLYEYLIGLPEYKESPQRQTLNRRVREVLMKQVPTIGAPKVAMALAGLLKAEQPGDATHEFLRQHTKLDEANERRGMDFLHLIYGEEATAKMLATWGPDFAWLTKDIAYGLIYSDDAVLDTLETELVTYTSVAGLGVFPSMGVHLAALQKLGLGLPEAEGVTALAKMVYAWTGQDTGSWPKVMDMVKDW